MGIERRRHARISVEQRCTVLGPRGVVAATMRDVSLVGAQLASDEAAAAELEHVELSVEATEAHEGLHVRARVMYQRERDGVLVAGVQFVDMDAQVHRRVTAFVEAALLGTGGGQRAHPRVTHRLEVVCSTKGSAKAMLQDISKGGARLQLGEEQEVADGQELSIAVTIGKLDRPLELHGHVVRCVTDAEGRRFAGVRLAPLDAGTEKLLYQLLQILVRG